MKNKILFLLIFVSLLSCKNDNKEQSDVEIKKDVAKDLDLFKVSFDLIIKKDDNLHLYYTQDGSINFDEKNSVWLPIKGSETVQKVTFNLPKDVLPTHLRVDFGFGKNENQSDVELQSFSMNYFDKKVEANNLDILNYFYPNKDCTIINPGSTTLKRLDKNQNCGTMLYPQILLTEKIKEMTLGNK